MVSGAVGKTDMLTHVRHIQSIMIRIIIGIGLHIIACRRQRSKSTLNKKVLFSSDKKNWETPQKFFDALNEEFHFTLDAAASHENHKCENYYTEEQDGLVQDWGGI